MPATKRGIYHNLKETRYMTSNSEVVYFFSSKLYRDKFLNLYKDHRNYFFEKMAKIVGKAPYNMSMLADVDCYLSIEKRGFLVKIRDNWIEDKEVLYLHALRCMHKKHSLDWEKVKRWQMNLE